MTRARPARRLACAVAALVALLISAGCRSSAPAPDEGPGALAWFQTSEENRQLQRSVFIAAARALEAALADPSWRALDQPPEAVELPPAVIADLDETMLDNSAFEVTRKRRGVPFSAEDWTSWVNAAEARAIPGAVEFASIAAEHGVTLFYVSNRDAEHEDATRRNLEELGFPLPAVPDVVLLRGERPEWTSDKESRRRRVAAGYRVLLLLGDDLNDFVSVPKDATLERRAELAASRGERFGVQWFVLPNPIYGSWKRALTTDAQGASGRGWLERLRGFE